MNFLNEGNRGYVGFGGNIRGTLKISENTKNKNKQMSLEDRVIYDNLNDAIKRGKADKFPASITRICKACREYNDATDASNQILEKRKKEIEDKYKK